MLTDVMLSVIMLIVANETIMLGVVYKFIILCIIMLSVANMTTILTVIMVSVSNKTTIQSVIILSADMLSVVAPSYPRKMFMKWTYRAAPTNSTTSGPHF